jgi:hypothetical protein
MRSVDRTGTPAHGQPRRAVCVLALLLAAVLPLAGCYRVVPLTEAPEPGMRIVAGLTREGTERMFEHIGEDVVRIEAEAGAMRADQWELRLISTWDRLGQEFPWQRQTVTFAPQHLHSVQQRELDRRRTWIAAGAITAGVLTLGRIFLKAFGGDEPGGGGQPVPPL